MDFLQILQAKCSDFVPPFDMPCIHISRCKVAIQKIKTVKNIKHQSTSEKSFCFSSLKYCVYFGEDQPLLEIL